MTQARSGKSSDAVTLDALRAGEVVTDDVRIHPDTLRAQAHVAAEHGNPQLAENLLRAAELALLDDARVMAIYEALRPGRSTREDLVAIIDELQSVAASRCAALVSEALQTYERRGLLR